MINRKYDLFRYMADEHNVTLLDSEMDDIINIIERLPTIDKFAANVPFEVKDVLSAQITILQKKASHTKRLMQWERINRIVLYFIFYIAGFLIYLIIYAICQTHTV